MSKMTRSIAPSVALLTALLVGCSGPGEDNASENNASENNASENNTSENNGQVQVPETYDFPSRFVEGESSVAYSGQTYRHVLIHDLNDYIGGQLEDDALTNTAFTSKEDFEAALLYFYEFDSASNGAEDIRLETTPAATQQRYDDIGSDKDLVGKTAGNDNVTDHRDWSSEFQGWSDEAIAAHGGGVGSPEQLIRAYLATLAHQANELAQGNAPVDPVGGGTLPVYVTPEGWDLKQLTQKTLLMAVAFSQGADDYLDDDTDGKGLLAANTQGGDSTYTPLEHAWDEAFGYFGAARDYAAYSDEEIAAKGGRDDWQGYHDSDGDGAIDLTAEYNFGASTNAAKRDLGGSTDFTAEAFDAFLTGRALIQAAGDEVDADELAGITAERDRAVAAWEGAIAATVVHYINDTLADMEKAGGEEYDFAHHAKVWGELKGFSIGFQFNPKSPMLTEDRFTTFHDLVGDRPVLPTDGEEAMSAYRDDLLEARALLQQAYGFSEADVEGW